MGQFACAVLAARLIRFDPERGKAVALAVASPWLLGFLRRPQPGDQLWE